MAAITYHHDATDAAIAAWLYDDLAARLAQAGDAGIAITVPGGATPFPILAALARMPLPFARLTIWPGDERQVPDDHPASNLGRIRAAFAATEARVMPLTADAAPPPFVLAWLGMGADGHIASLFPSMDPRADDPLRVRVLTPDPLPPEAPFARVTLTIPALVASEALLVVIRGAAKRALFLAAAASDNDLPIARLLAAARCPVTCFC